MPAENLTVTAQWTVNQYTITFDTAGGSAIAPITQDYGSAITAPAAPTREGYTFTGWDKTIPATMPAGDMTITAQWTVNQYTITYDLDGGTAEGNPDTYTVETDAFTLKNPTRPGYTFTGWSGTGLTGEDNLTVTIPKGSTGNRSYTAHWSLNTYSITYDLNGGTASGNPTSYTVESATITLNQPTKTGYTFTGWSGTDLTGEDNLTVTIPAGSTGDRSYTAHWSLNTYYYNKFWLEAQQPAGLLSISCLSYNKGSNWLTNTSLGFHVRYRDCQPSPYCGVRFEQVEP